MLGFAERDFRRETTMHSLEVDWLRMAIAWSFTGTVLLWLFLFWAYQIGDRDA